MQPQPQRQGFWYNDTEFIEVDEHNKLMNYKSPSQVVSVPLKEIKKVRIYDGVVIVDYRKSSKLRYLTNPKEARNIQELFINVGVEVIHKS